MKYFLLLMLLPFSTQRLFSQTAISNDGKYAFTLNKTLYIKSTFDSWSMTIPEAAKALFTSNDKILYCRKDTLYTLVAGTSEISVTPNVQEFQKATNNGHESLVYLSSGDDKTMHILDIQSEKEVCTAPNVADFSLSPDGHCIIFKESLKGSTGIRCLFLSDPGCSPQFVTTANVDLENFTFDAEGKQLAFHVPPSHAGAAIWYFKSGMDSAKLLVREGATALPPGFRISQDNGIFGFTHSGANFYFLLENIPDKTKPKKGMPSVDVWSYDDALIQPQQLTWASSYEQLYRPRYLASINLAQPDARPVLLQHRGQILCGAFGGFPEDNLSILPEINNNYVLIFEPNGNLASDFAGEQQGYLLSDYKWSRATTCRVYLVCLNTGKQTLLKEMKLRSSGSPLFKFTPDQNYIIYFDASIGQYFSYELNSGKTRNISLSAGTSWINGNPESQRDYFDAKRNFLTWINNNSHLLAIDHFGDCWDLDPTGKSDPKILTDYLGKKQHIEFYPVSGVSGRPYRVDTGTLLFHAERNRLQSGYYSVDPAGAGTLNKIIFGEYNSPGLIKASSANLFLLSLETSKSPREWYFYNPISSSLSRIGHQDQKKRNPIQKELFHWKTFDGSDGIGLLWKPQIFDPTKKYPVIISYYEKFATLLYANKYQEYDANATSASWSAGPPLQYCLNHGYLVFEVDISYKIGSAGQSVYNYVVSAAKYLGTKPFVDAGKIGIEGHSFGGWETNYLVTHTNVFAAAVSGSGISNIPSLYGEINNDPQGYPHYDGQIRIGVSPWDRPDLFIKNSPWFYADKVSTPVLLMANKNDLRVPYSQGIAFFKSLRRLGKRCWLLQYDNAGHTLDRPEDATDFGIRQMQFFDHYLKGAPAPVWMTRGVPSSLKSKTLGYEYDSTIKTPGPGLLMENDDAYTPEERELLKHKTTVNSEGRIVDVTEPKTKITNTKSR